jgi:hypothetical protein
MHQLRHEDHKVPKLAAAVETIEEEAEQQEETVEVVDVPEEVDDQSVLVQNLTRRLLVSVE